ncbi:DNA gyrase subunit A [Patescibacteria group bacterium]|nr:MAG: DNA gyrase subunit A [Patescibacteria group bacterium]
MTEKNQNPIGKIEKQILEKEMSEAYLDYAMSVIVQRALPDARDGLKPVHRRILYAMWSIGLKSGAKFRKSATVVGEVLGKYHPHGDVAVYDAMVRMAQDFNMRYPMVWGQGNFGSVDGDGAAAMRYTESKLAKIAEELLSDIEKKTVDFAPNYDGVHEEPKVLPAKLPNLILNGTSGIAVGMATNIPPHNLGEIVGALLKLIDQPESSIEELMEFIKGPDFPTGGQIFNADDIRQVYATGKGGIVIRARAEIIEDKGHSKIIVTELPFQVNKSDLLTHIAELVKDKKIEGIKDLRDESDKDGIRVMIELKREAYPRKVLNRLFAITSLQQTFHVNMLALVDGIQPRVLTLKMVLEEYLKHREEVIKRRAQYELEKARDREHILKGLKIALVHLDEIIKIIKKSQDRDEARVNLIKKFKLSEPQANAILDMRLHQLTNLDRLRVEQELEEKQKLIKDLEALLASRKKVYSVIKSDLLEIKEAYADERRTEVVAGKIGEFTQEDLIPNESAVIMITGDGYIKRIPPDSFKTQSRGGKGVVGLTTKEEDEVEHLFTTTTHANLLFFTTKGRVFQLKAYDVPQASRTAKGQAIVNFLNLAGEEKVSSILPLGDLKGYNFLMMVTRQAVIKKVDIKDFESVRRSGIIAIKLKGSDELMWVKPTTGDDEAVLVSGSGQAIRFKEKVVRPMGRTASGVRGMRLKGRDEIRGMDIVSKEREVDEILVVMANGFGKRTALKEYRLQGRGGSGIKVAKITDKTGPIVALSLVSGKIGVNDLVIMSKKGQVIRLPFKTVPTIGRATQGVRLMRFSEDKDTVASVTLV